MQRGRGVRPSSGSSGHRRAADTLGRCLFCKPRSRCRRFPESRSLQAAGGYSASQKPIQFDAALSAWAARHAAPLVIHGGVCRLPCSQASSSRFLPLCATLPRNGSGPLRRGLVGASMSMRQLLKKISVTPELTPEETGKLALINVQRKDYRKGQRDDYGGIICERNVIK